MISSRSSLQKDYNASSPMNNNAAMNSNYITHANTAELSGAFNGFNKTVTMTNKRTSNVTLLKMENERALQELRDDG